MSVVCVVQGADEGTDEAGWDILLGVGHLKHGEAGEDGEKECECHGGQLVVRWVFEWVMVQRVDGLVAGDDVLRGGKTTRMREVEGRCM